MPGTIVNVDSGTGDVAAVEAAYNNRLVGYSCAETASSADAAEVAIRHGTSATDPLAVARINLDANGFGHFNCDIVVPAGIFIDRISGETEVVLYMEKM